MTPRHNFIIGITLVTVAVTLALAIGTGRQQAESDQAEHEEFNPAVRTPRGVDGPRFSGHDPRRPRPPSATTRGAPEPWRVEAGAKPHLAASANQVERYAASRVEQLARKLSLDEAQQQRIFPLIARSSQSYDPAMIMQGGGLAAGAEMTGLEPLAPEESQAMIEKVLTPEQQMGWIGDSIDDLVLWQEIIANLTRQLDQVPAPGTPTTPTVQPLFEEPAPLPSSRGGQNLFE